MSYSSNDDFNDDFSFSNRCFWTKAISIWTSTGDADHVMIVGSYFHYAGGFEPPQVITSLIFSFHAYMKDN